MKRRAEMGVGTLIIFIALLLVAAVAAGVLIQTAGSLQQKALSTGTQATGQISTNAVVLEVSAQDGRSTGTLDNISMIMKLAPGSEPIKLDDVTMTLSTVNSTQTLTYRAGNPTGDTDDFGVTYLQVGPNNQTGVIVRGDVIEVNMQASRELVDSEFVRISFIPKIGTTTLTEFYMPDVISTKRVYLYP